MMGGSSPGAASGSARSSRRLYGVHGFERGVAGLIKMPDGEIVPVHYEGELGSSAILPLQGSYIGQDFSVGTTRWIWFDATGNGLSVAAYHTLTTAFPADTTLLAESNEHALRPLAQLEPELQTVTGGIDS